MGLFDKLESKLEQGVNGAFARAFKAEVQPVEIASGMRRAMDDRAASVKKGQRPVVPNLFTIELSPTDYERLSGWGRELDDELIASAQEHCDEQRYLPGGPLTVVLAEEDDLETGVFRLRPATAKAADALAHSRNHPRPEPARSAPQADSAGASAARSDTSAKRNTSGAHTHDGFDAATSTSRSYTGNASATNSGAAVNAPLSERIKSYLKGEPTVAASSAPHNEPATSHEASDAFDSEPEYDSDYEYDATEYDAPRPNSQRQDSQHAEALSIQRNHDDDSLIHNPDDDDTSYSGYDEYAGTSASQARAQQPANPRNDSHHGERGDAVAMPARKPAPQATPAQPAPAPRSERPAPAPAATPSPARTQHADDTNFAADSTARFTPPPAPASRARTTSPRQRPWLKIDGQRYPLLGAITTLGRDDDADIVIDDPGVSRRHSEIRITHDGPHLVMSVRDLGSTNGTFVNGDRIDSEHLRDGDRLTIGRTHMTIHPGDRA